MLPAKPRQRLLYPKPTFVTASGMSAMGQYGHRHSLITSSAAVNNPRPALAGGDHLDWETLQALAALSDVTGGDLVLVGGEGCQDFGLLALWDLGEVQGPSEFCCDLIKFCGGDAKVPMCLFKA